MMPAVKPPRRRQPYKQVPVDAWKRISEFETCLHGKVFDSDTGRRRCSFALNHYAWLPDGTRRMDTFLDTEAHWMGHSERERLKSDALADMRTYDAAEAGEIVDLTWDFRCAHDIRTIAAIDTPPANVVDAQRRERYAASKRAGRALKRKPIPANKQRSLDSQRRRLAAIHDALSEGAMSVADLCRVLGKARNGPFNMVPKQDLPRVVRRVIEQDQSLRTEIRAVQARPDLRPSMWVMINVPEKETIVPTKLPPPSLTIRPTTPAGYRIYFEHKLATFTDRDEVLEWFSSEMPAFKDLGFLEDETYELQELVVARRREPRSEIGVEAIAHLKRRLR
jgi:hypothetical protein